LTRIAILTPSITTADAVGNDVFGMYRVLKRLNHNTQIFAEGWSTVEERIWPSHQIGNFLKKPSDLLIYHYSRGWDFGLKVLSELKCRKAIKYHNVTPPDFFNRFSDDLVRMCFEGRNQLKLIARAGCDLYMSASAYNERELLEEGVDEGRSFVVPPFHHIDRLEAVQADRKILDAYRDGKTNILMVGRVAPNKGHPALIQAFAAYHRDYNSNSRLFIVGKEETRLAAYNRLLREVAKYLKVQDAVIIAGEVSDSALKAYYSVANVFMMTSEHEGFCVPLVEAMSMKIPIVAYSSTAIPDTVGDVGLVWKERNPYLLAQSIDSIAGDKSVSEALGRMGRQRYQRLFTNERIENRFVHALDHLG
jgi:glycosyltransferase involved in cell wall biosynthesis